MTTPSDIMQQEMARRIDALELANTQLTQAILEVNRRLNAILLQGAVYVPAGEQESHGFAFKKGLIDARIKI